MAKGRIVRLGNRGFEFWENGPAKTGFFGDMRSGHNSMAIPPGTIATATVDTVTIGGRAALRAIAAPMQSPLRTSFFTATPVASGVLINNLAVPSYNEPSDADLVDDINLEIRSCLGGEIVGKLQVLVQAIFNDIAREAGVKTTDYHIHVLASETEANAIASPGGHIWITIAALRGWTLEVDPCSRSGHTMYRRVKAPFFASPQSIPFALGHELEHQLRDTRTSLRRYRKTRRDHYTTGSGRSNWMAMLEESLPGGKTYRQEVRADSRAVQWMERAGYPMADFLSGLLRSGDTVTTNHPSNASRGWQNGTRAARGQLATTVGNAKISAINIELGSYPQGFAGNLRESFQLRQAQDPWQNLTLVADQFRFVRGNPLYDCPDYLPFQRAFQESIVRILNLNPCMETLLALRRVFLELTDRNNRSNWMAMIDPLLRMSESTSSEPRDALNDSTRYSSMIDSRLDTELGKILPDIRVSFSPLCCGKFNNNTYSLDRLIALTAGERLLRLFNDGRISFFNFLSQAAEIMLILDAGKMRNILVKASSPSELASWCQLICRLVLPPSAPPPFEFVSSKRADRQWVAEANQIATGYFTYKMALYLGDHITIMRDKGWIPAGSTIEESAQIVARTFGNDKSPLYRSAEEWPTGDLAGLIRLFPSFACDPSTSLGKITMGRFKEILDEAGTKVFKESRKPRFRVPRYDFALRLGWAVRAASKGDPTISVRLSGEPPIIDGSFGTIRNQRLLDAIRYSRSDAEYYLGTTPGSSAEKEALRRLMGPLETARIKTKNSLRIPFVLEHHLMGQVPVRGYAKRARMLQAALAGAGTMVGLRTFAESGKIVFMGGDEVVMRGDGVFEIKSPNDPGSFLRLGHLSENHYAAALDHLANVVETPEQAADMLRSFDLTKAPLVRYKIEAIRYNLSQTNKLTDPVSFHDFLQKIDQCLSLDNPYRWILFMDAWERFDWDIGDVALSRILSSLPNLNLCRRRRDTGNERKKAGGLNATILTEIFNAVRQESPNPPFYDDMRGDFDWKYFFRRVQTLEREIYESAVRHSLIASDHLVRLRQVESIFRSSVDAGVAHPILDRVRLDYMQTIPFDSVEYAAERKKLIDPSAVAKAGIPFLNRDLAEHPLASHDEQRGYIRNYLPVGAERDRYLDLHLSTARGLTSEESDRYDKLYSRHPNSDMRGTTSMLVTYFDGLVRLCPIIKYEFVRYYMSHGSQPILSRIRSLAAEHAPDDNPSDIEGYFLDCANYLFERSRDEQVAFFHHLFMGELSIMSETAIEERLMRFVLLGGGNSVAGRLGVVSDFLEAVYRHMDPWDRGCLISELIVDLQSPVRVAELRASSLTPQHIVRIMRIIRGFGPKTAQILRSHRGILGNNPEAEAYRRAFEGFEEHAQRVDISEAWAAIGSFSTYVRSIDGVLGAGKAKMAVLATLTDGRKVVIKFLSPDYNGHLSHGFRILAAAVEDVEAKRETYDSLPFLRPILETARTDISTEGDLRREHDVYRRLRSLVEMREEMGLGGIAVFPMTQQELGLPPPMLNGVVVMEEFLEGVSIENVPGLEAIGTSQNEAARLFVREMLEELLVDGTFDYDVRPSNWRVLNYGDGMIKIGAFDKAQTVFLGERGREGVVTMLFGIQAGDAGVFVDGLRALDGNVLAVDRSRLVATTEAVLKKWKTNPHRILQEILEYIEREGVEMTSSNSMKLMMWLLQLNRYIEMSQGLDVQNEIEAIMRTLSE